MARKLEWHDTPNHGSWLHMVETALRVLQHQGLDRRSPAEDTLKREIAAGEHQRHAEQATIDGRFSVTEARKKLERLSPSLPASWSTSPLLPRKGRAKEDYAQASRASWQ